ncbi:MAG TPA: hypothetical protein VMR95_02965 [Candidatus Binatia bacterium]|nr:hypothetical protein [Candidatus Binatia bacterium]
MFKRSKKSDNNPRKLSRSIEPRRGSDSYAYRAVRQESNSSALKRQPELLKQHSTTDTSAQLKRLKVAFIVVVLAGVFITMSWLNSSPKIILLGSNEDRIFLRSTETYETAAINLLNGSLSNHNKLTLNTDYIANALEQEFPELGTVTVQAPLVGDSVNIYLEPATPALLLTSISGTKVALDSSGVAIEQVNDITKLASLQLPSVTDQSGLNVQLHKAVLSSDDVAFIQTIVEQLATHKLQVIKLILPSGSSELDAYPSGVSYYIKFNLEDENDVNQQVGTFLATRTYLLKNSITPSQYIDVRTLGRAYYK